MRKFYKIILEIYGNLIFLDEIKIAEDQSKGDLASLHGQNVVITENDSMLTIIHLVG